MDERPPAEGPRQVWMWSRMDGTVTRHRVRPSKFVDCWVEEYSNGWTLWGPERLCSSPEEAAYQARDHFRRQRDRAMEILARIEAA